jgi:hypothetical protein
MKIFTIISLIVAITFVFPACSNNNSAQVNQANPEETPTLERNENSPYSVSSEEENTLKQNVQKILNNETYILFESDLELLKKTFNEGYFVVVKIGSKKPEEVKTYYDPSITDRGSRMNLLIHELTHVASDICFMKDLTQERCELRFFDQKKYTFQKDNLYLTTNYDSEKLHTKQVLRQYLDDELTEIDETYLNKENGDIFGTLDEINAYTKSMRAQIAYKDIDSQEQLYFEYLNLQRQLFHLALDLTYAKNESPNEWSYLTKDPGIAYIIYNFKKDAEKELSRVNIDSEDLTDSTIQNIQNTKEQLKEYESIFEDYFSESVIREGEKELPYTDINLGKISIQNETVT